MANLYFYLDKRGTRKDGTKSLKIALTHRHKTVYYSLDVFIKEDEWDKEQGAVINRANRRFLNTVINKQMTYLETMLANACNLQDCDKLSARELMDLITGGKSGKKQSKDMDNLVAVYEEYISLCKKPSTANLFRFSLNNLRKYEPDLDVLRFSDISVTWLRRYQNWMWNEKKMTVNGANVYLRNLRAVFNHALKNHYTTARYPFEDIDMSTTEPDKETIPYETFLEWATMPMPDSRAFYRDLFMLSFYLCGIRPVDLLHVKNSQVEEGRLVYYPEKLGGRTKLSIKIEPEAWEIINKYKGDEHLIDVMDKRSDYKSFLKHWNTGVRAVGEDVITQKKGCCGQTYTTVKHNSIVPYITVYYARTCFATYAFNVANVPIDIISQAMGHKNGLKVTNFYVKRDPALVDKANRSLIDQVTKDMRKFAKKKGWLE